PVSATRRRPPANLRFACALGEQPSWLVPRRLLLPNSHSRALLQLNVNVRCWFGRRTMPASVAERTRPPGQFHDGNIVWVGGINPGVTPFWLGPRLSALLGTTRPGKPAPKELSARERALLVAAGILVDAGYLERQRRHVATVVRQAARWFREG